MRCPACDEISAEMARFCAQCGARLTSASATDGAADNERRQISVILCDLVDSTPLSRRLDPEELAEVIHAYQMRVAAAIQCFGGYLARYVGDGVLCYFGWPENTEADPERAVRASLAIVEAVTKTPIRGQSLEMRVGVATGLVVLGKPVGSGEARQLTASGQTPNLAARLQGIAEPNGIVIDDATRRQIGALFTCRDLGDCSLKGFETPVRAWSVLGTRLVSDRFAALRAARLVPLVSRLEELGLLMHRWQQAAAGEGQLVLLAGEAGIGKSRLVAELRAQLRRQPHTSLRYFCSSYYQASPLHPIIARLEHEAGFGQRDGPADKLRRLQAVLQRSDASVADVSLIADLLGIPADGSTQLTPQARKSRTFEALARRVVGLTRRQPLLLVAEDAHWADASSLELLDKIIELLPELPILLIVSTRGEPDPAWLRHGNATQISLSRLARSDATRLAEEVVAGNTLPPGLLERIVAQSEGIPLFIEELTKSVLENAASPDGVPPVLTVPTSLQASLTARLDRLSAAKLVAQIGAVIGRQFSQSLLASVAQVPAEQLSEGLEELVAAGLASRRGDRVGVIYTFRHALFQEAIYDGLLRRRRGEIHTRIVSAAESDASLGLTDPGLLGYHCAHAGLLAKAASYYRIAGGRSAERAAVVESGTNLERGLHVAGNLPDGPDRHRLEAELHIAHGRILMATKGPDDREAGLALERALIVCRKLGEPNLLARALYSLGVMADARAELDAAQAVGEALLGLAQSSGDAGVAIAASVRLGLVAYYTGDFISARSRLADALTVYAAGINELRDTAIASDPHVVAAAYLSVTLAHLGDVDQAMMHGEAAVANARKIGSSSPAYALALSVWQRTLEVLRDDEKCGACAQALVTVAREQGFAYLLAIGQSQQGWALARQGELVEGEALIAQALTVLKRLGAQLGKYLLSDVLTLAGRHAEALAAVEEMLALSRQSGATWLDAELHRKRGELLLIAGNNDFAEAERELHEAVNTARKQSAKLLELRAATSLARLWSTCDRRTEALALLQPIYGYFGGRADVPDVREAAALIAKLGSVASMT